ncbi:hypothetical protein N7470_006906 [Penicillium chermesinum]|nr:hypothetical protein N7470_006906 [Penicillium chermesinum]
MVKQKKQGEPDLPHKPVKSLGENGMTEGPCGRCPSFRLCSPGAAISPETCEYFDPWMQNVLGFLTNSRYSCHARRGKLNFDMARI